MSNKKINDLTPADSVGGADLFEIEQDGESKKGTLDQMLEGGNVVKKQTDYPTPIDENEIIACLKAAGLCASLLFCFALGMVFPNAVAATQFGNIARTTDVSTLWESPFVADSPLLKSAGHLSVDLSGKQNHSTNLDAWSLLATSAKESPLIFQQSLSRSGNTVTFVNDSATPGNSKYYGTNGSGTKGFFDLPSSGASLFTALDFTGSNTISLDLLAPLTLHSTGDSDDVAAHPYTAANSGIFIKDANNSEVLRIWASDPDVVDNYNSGNLYIGYQTGLSQPSDNTSAGFQNTGIGYQALYSITTGYSNSAIGDYALYSNTTGEYGTAIGAFALNSSTADYNTAIGAQALEQDTTGYANTAIGYYAGDYITTGIGNMAFGAYALSALRDGFNNIAIGVAAGANDGVTNISVHDNQMIFIGSAASRPGDGTTTLTDGIAIGANALVTTSHTAVIGGSTVTDVYLGSVDSNATLHSVSAILKPGAAPGSPVEGQIYENSSDHHLYFYNGTTWKQLDN
jgi:hypothetical protein